MLHLIPTSRNTCVHAYENLMVNYNNNQTSYEWNWSWPGGSTDWNQCSCLVLVLEKLHVSVHFLWFSSLDCQGWPLSLNHDRCFHWSSQASFLCFVHSRTSFLRFSSLIFPAVSCVKPHPKMLRFRTMPQSVSRNSNILPVPAHPASDPTCWAPHPLPRVTVAGQMASDF